MYRSKIENEKAKVKQRRQNSKAAENIMEWAVRKQRAHDQMVIARMYYGADKEK